MKILIHFNAILMSVFIVANLALAEPSETNSTKTGEVTFIKHEDSLEHNELAKRFQNPPDSARPGVYWYFMDVGWLE